MNDVQAAPAASLLPESTGLITGIHFVMIALFAVAVLAMIVVGIRRKRRRRHAERVVEERIEAAEAEPAPVPQPERPAGPSPVPAAAPPATPRPEPSPIAVEPDAARSATPAALPVTPAEDADRDDPAAGPVGQLKGLGPKVAARLAELGITTVGQLAALNEAEAAALDTRLGPFAGRLVRDRWIEQAQLLAAGDRAGFEATFGRL